MANLGQRHEISTNTLIGRQIPRKLASLPVVRQRYFVTDQVITAQHTLKNQNRNVEPHIIIVLQYCVRGLRNKLPNEFKSRFNSKRKLYQVWLDAKGKIVLFYNDQQELSLEEIIVYKDPFKAYDHAMRILK